MEIIKGIRLVQIGDMVVSPDYGEFAVCEGDVFITNEEIESLVNIEMDICSHVEDYPENETFEELQKFFLGNVILDDYDQFVRGHIDDKKIDNELMECIIETVRDEIIEQINKRLEENEEIEIESKPIIIYKESKTLNSEIDFAKLIDEKAENTKIKLFEQSNCLNIDEIELNKILSKACEIKKIIIYSKYNDEIISDEILYKRNQNNTISIFEKMEQ